jgi:plastocyanin
MNAAGHRSRCVAARAAAICVAWACALVAGVSRAETTVTIRDGAGHAVVNAGVAIELADDTPRTADALPRVAVMDQKNEQFVPDFLVVRVGTEISFPNSDQVLHHVYSFSPARVFELPLYRGVLPSPVRFDREGIVTIGCNIHDHMVGHVWVVNTPTFAQTDAQGRATFDALPAGTHRLLAWHPRLGRSGVVSKPIVVGADGNGEAGLVLAVAPVERKSGALAWHDAY